MTDLTAIPGGKSKAPRKPRATKAATPVETVPDVITPVVPSVPADVESDASPVDSKSWSLTWKGKTWTEDDLTSAHLAAIAAGRGVDDWDFNPTKGPLRLLCVLAAFISFELEKPLALVLEDLRSVPAVELVAALTVS